jgi:hypothetical protein
MDNILEFAEEVASAIIGAMGLAMCLEWLALNGLMNLMPRNDGVRSAPAIEAKAAIVSARKSGPKGLAGLTLFPH